MTLTQNKQYEANITLTGIESFAPNEMVAKKLTDVGFTNVVVTGAGKARTATGTWTGATQKIELPKQVTSIKTV